MLVDDYMMSSFRRLVKDHATLRASLPPNFLFLHSDDTDGLPDDLTQLSIHLTGSDGTPYASGLWLLHLRIPQDYPRSPPKATFKTRIFHPNVEETTGAVCLETLKRDWDPKLTLKDILVTISCLLIQPNPDSALNEKAGVLVREDYDGYLRQARLMTKIHAPIPTGLREAVDEARSRGEEVDGTNQPSKTSARSLSSAYSGRPNEEREKGAGLEIYGDIKVDLAKENDPSCRTTKPHEAIAEHKRTILGKRSLAELVVQPESDEHTVLSPTQTLIHRENGERPRKSPKHTHQQYVDGMETAVTADDASCSLLDTSRPQDAADVDFMSTAPSQQISKARPKPTKYRTHARVGIKRL